METSKYIETTCKNCNKHITKLNKFREQNYYCDMKCYREHQKSGKYNLTGITTVDYKCDCCGEDFKAKAKDKNNKKNFCSRECYLKDHEMKLVTCACAGCGDDFTSQSALNQKYCSVKCRQKHRVSTCLSCGVDFCAVSFNNGVIRRPLRKTCSEKCHHELYKTDIARKEKISRAFTGDKHPLWMGGRSYKQGRRGKMWKSIREECFKEKGESCQECGITRKEHKAKYGCDVHIDHIKAYHSFTSEDEANKLSNLRPLCLSCHGKLGSKAKLGNYAVA